MAGFRVEGNTSGNVAEVDTSNQLKVVTGTDPDNVGFIALAGEINDGSVTGAREVLKVGVSEANRLEVGVDSLVHNDSFNYTAQNTANYLEAVTTQTVTHTAGYVLLNGSNITTINTNSATQTRRSFPIYGGFGLEVKIAGLHTAAPQLNAVTEWGLFTATLPGAAIPTDGVYFRFNVNGEFRCIINYAGTEIATSAALTAPSININHDYEISINEETVVFSVDGIVVYDIDTPAGFAQPYSQACLPITARHYIGGSAPASAMQFKIGAMDCNLGDMNTTKPWAHVMCTQGLSGYQGQNGGTMGSTALYTNSLAPGAGAAMTNTTAALGTGLGGQFSTQPTLAANTDGIVCSYQNPAGTTAITGRTLVITGIRIDGIVTTALTGGPVYYLLSLAFGHTAVSLATAEAATTKAARRIPLGLQSYPVTAAVGALATTINLKFDAPVVLYPGEFVAVVAKNVGTVTSAGVITFLIGFDAYNE